MPLNHLTVGEVIELLQQHPHHHTVAVSTEEWLDDSHYEWTDPEPATEVMANPTGEPCSVVIR